MTSGTREAPVRSGLRGGSPGPSLGGTARLYLAVAAGSAIGGTMRWLVSWLLQGEGGATVIAGVFPWGTLFVNVTGSFLIGLYAGLTAPDGRLLASPSQRQFVMVGMLGGYTTFSIFSLETVRLLESGRWLAVGLGTVTSVVAWLVAVWAGYALALHMNRLQRKR